MKCPKCNTENKNNTKFCTKCGYHIEEYLNEQKEKKKEKFLEKIFQVKKWIAIILIFIFIVSIVILIGGNTMGKLSHKSENYNQTTENNKEEEEKNKNENNLIYSDFRYNEEIELTEDLLDRDFDYDGLTNQEEKDLKTNLYNKDTDNDGLSDYDEVKKYISDPTKYSTSGDQISDYIKVNKKLDIDKKYDLKDVKAEEVKKNSYITLKPKDVISEVYGGMEEYTKDTKVNALYNTFDMLNYEGTVEYSTNNDDAILLIIENGKYKKFNSYENKKGVLKIEISKDDNYKDFVITTKEAYENYKNGINE